MYKKIQKIILSSLTLFFMCMVICPLTVYASGKKPVITLTSSTKKYTNKPLKIEVDITSSSKITTVKWASGRKNFNYFQNSGNILKLNTKNHGEFLAKSNGVYSVYTLCENGNKSLQEIKISNIDKTAPVVKLNYSVMNRTGTISVSAKDTGGSSLKSLAYLKGNFTASSAKWKSAKKITNKKFTVKQSGTYSVLAKDAVGNKSVKKINVQLELKAVWISYLEFQALAKETGYNNAKFQKEIDKIMDQCKKLKMNAVVVQVRAFGDAMYKSDYFPWSAYASGKQGKNPGYDPLTYMIKAAHKKGLAFHAWINPYRVSNSASYANLSSDNQAKIWHNSTNEEKKRNVLSFDGKLYYNPSKKDVQNLIVNGVKEVVRRYGVDGIHFDDYFYPTLNSNYKKNFDAKEYNAYKKSNGNKSIVSWRRDNVNTLVKRVYSEIKKINPSVQFGISPAGNIKNLKRSDAYYVDIEKWLASSDYVDYICPQIYWSFTNPVCPFAKTVDNWNKIRKSKTVNMYIGIANYRAGSTLEEEWKKKNDVLKRQIEYSRKTGKVDGFMFFRYDFFFNKTCKKEIDNLMKVL